jgi:polyhydroxybutyrate depolymerase
MGLTVSHGIKKSAILVMVLSASACSSGSDDKAVGEPLPDDLSSGTFTVGLEHGGLDRTAVVFVPESYSSAADTPLVLNFHGFGGSARYHLEDGDLRPQAEAAGGLLVVPQGSELDGLPHWNPSEIGGDNKSTADDFGFVVALLGAVQAAYPFNADRVSAVGYSNGGMMAMGLACQRSDLIASAGSVSGAWLGAGCELSHPMPVVTFHGTQDRTIPYDGSGDYPSAMDVVDYWRSESGAAEEDPVTLTDGGTSIEYWAHDGGTNGSAIHHYRVDGGDHVWFRFSADGRSANDRIWDFLTAYSVDGLL